MRIMNILYNIAIAILNLIVRLVAPFNNTIGLWAKGVSGWQDKISEKIRPGDRVIWMHCASLGEFEQGRPVIEALRRGRADLKIVLTFFSPSGYEVRKGYAGADCIIYLPSDTAANASRLVKMLNPEFVIFVKYEFWNNYISELYRNQIPLYLISAIFRPGQHFFKWHGAFFRKMLGKFRMIFVQDKQSLELLSSIGLNNMMFSGDTRFDRVAEIADSAREIPLLEKFRGDERLFLAGSSWRPDEEIICRYINSYPGKMKWVFAPHMIDKQNIDRLEKLFEVPVARFSAYDPAVSEARVLIIDNIGMLSSAYRYASIAEVGGGFGTGIHNVLEPACWGIPVLFGPNHLKFREAVELIISGGGRSFQSYDEFEKTVDEWLSNEISYIDSAKAAGTFVKENIGATDIIIQEIGSVICLTQSYH